jgi:hypothetical protein
LLKQKPEKGFVLFEKTISQQFQAATSILALFQLSTIVFMPTINSVSIQPLFDVLL